MEKTFEKQLPPRGELTIKINTTRAALLIASLSLSSMYYGFLFPLISSGNIDAFYKYYDIGLSIPAMKALLNGAYPLGGVIGGFFIVPKTLQKFKKKKQVMYSLAVVSFFVSCMVGLPWLQTLVLCRFFFGIVSAHQMAVSVAMCRQFFTQQLLRPFGAVFSTFIVFGDLICYIIGAVFSSIPGEKTNIILFFSPTFLLAIQVVLLYFYVPTSPLQLLKSKQLQKTKQCLLSVYQRVQIANRIKALQRTIQNEPNQPPAIVDLRQPRHVCTIILPLMMQFSGVPFLVVYSRALPLQSQNVIGQTSAVVANTCQFFGGLLGIILIMKASRYHIIQISILISVLVNIALAIADAFLLVNVTYGLICFFMFIYGAGIYPSLLIFPIQLSPEIRKYFALASWTGSCMVNVIPPFVMEYMPDNKAYPIFIFFFLFMFTVMVLNYFYLPRPKEVAKPANQAQDGNTDQHTKKQVFIEMQEYITTKLEPNSLKEQQTERTDSQSVKSKDMSVKLIPNKFL